MPNGGSVDKQVKSLAIGAPLKMSYRIWRIGEGRPVELVFPKKGAADTRVDFVGGNAFGIVEGFEASLLSAVGCIVDVVITRRG
ncbi:MAG TPA: hypothetical protein DD620_02625 [Verrucomicrobia bacterium]|nr:hypothetical protein [Kiritimatiellaceae bacterium]HBO87629.1 hypothetical protein [Verrucomicrobiota bacterium]|tara:strand:- start:470 stop:721 length:252 start_codon:yes stop_codon:yes gene_type:complete